MEYLFDGLAQDQQGTTQTSILKRLLAMDAKISPFLTMGTRSPFPWEEA